MKANRLLQLAIFATLAIIALGVVLPSLGSGASKEINHPNVGLGDVRLFEAQKPLPESDAKAKAATNVGMGDVRRFEAQKSVPESYVQANATTKVGMGDLHLFEVSQ